MNRNQVCSSLPAVVHGKLLAMLSGKWSPRNLFMHLSASMRCESHFKSPFGNVNAFNLKKLKFISEPVAALAAGGPAAGGRWQANSLGRPKAGPSLERNPSNSFQKPLEVQ